MDDLHSPGSVGIRRRLIVLHGWGADASDLWPIANNLRKRLIQIPELIVLQAPESCASTSGRQWYGLFPAEWDAVPKAVEELLHRLDALETSELPLSRTVLLGFSQGGAMAVQVGCQRPLAGIVGCSAYPHPGWTAPIERPPVLLLHGRHDEIVPFEACTDLHNRLGTGVERTMLPFPGGHTIPDDQLAAIAMTVERWFSAVDTL
ncbi:esterase [cyanobiont of Ornithocercus magnificus]|nr:esterase [cyanobiont of Ornithocercus magnificus]